MKYLCSKLCFVDDLGEAKNQLKKTFFRISIFPYICRLIVAH
ncbi:MAG: hypothetical protein JWQ79_1105 [Mucilaginibacter sp.]|nr:hypothetical protein [Mucilaginibacter sp.]